MDDQIVRTINNLDQLFLNAESTNSPESWRTYLNALEAFENSIMGGQIKSPRSYPNLLGVTTEEALNANPVGQPTYIVQRWRKSLHRAEATKQALIERYVMLTELLKESVV